MKHKTPFVTKLILIALIANSSAVAGTILLSHHLADVGGGNVIGNDTLIPIGVIVVLMALAIKATWALGKFCDRITKFESRLEKVEQRLLEECQSKH